MAIFKWQLAAVIADSHKGYKTRKSRQTKEGQDA